MESTPGWSVVSGASGAIGPTVVARLIARGHRVVALARDVQQLAQLAPGAAGALRTVAADVCDPGLGERLDATLGDDPVRMVVHMAAAPTAGGILHAPPEAILAAVNVKVIGMLNLVRACRHRLEPDARLVAVGGNQAYDPQPAAAVSGIANAALANVVRQLQRAFGGTGITSYMVAPGPVATRRFDTLVATEAERLGISFEEAMRGALAASPLGRLTAPEEVAWAISLLGDPEATALGGSTLLLDCGRRSGIP